MPKQTFFNLSEEKREIILQVAIDEFAENMYKNASVTKIAERSGISKGSMYQYFQDKTDLYRYILAQIGTQKITFLNDCIKKQDHISFISMIRMLYQKGLEFTFAFPKLASIGNNFLKEDAVIKEAILKDNIEKSTLFFVDLIEKAKARGEIHPEIDAKAGAFMIYHFNNALIDSLLSSMAYEELFTQQEVYFKKVDDLLFILENGFVTLEYRRVSHDQG